MSARYKDLYAVVLVKFALLSLFHIVYIENLFPRRLLDQLCQLTRHERIHHSGMYHYNSWAVEGAFRNQVWQKSRQPFSHAARLLGAH